MFINETVVAVVFRLCNFFLVIALAAYAFRKYILPVVHDHMVKAAAERELLSRQRTILEHKLSELGELIQHDAQIYQDYALKIDMWKRMVAQETAQIEKESHARMVIAADKEHRKNELRNDMQLRSLIAKKTAADLHASLSSYFEREDAGEVYLENIVRFMNEKSL